MVSRDLFEALHLSLKISVGLRIMHKTLHFCRNGLVGVLNSTPPNMMQAIFHRWLLITSKRSGRILPSPSFVDLVQAERRSTRLQLPCTGQCGPPSSSTGVPFPRSQRSAVLVLLSPRSGPDGTLVAAPPCSSSVFSVRPFSTSSLDTCWTVRSGRHVGYLVGSIVRLRRTLPRFHAEESDAPRFTALDIFVQHVLVSVLRHLRQRPTGRCPSLRFQRSMGSEMAPTETWVPRPVPGSFPIISASLISASDWLP